MLYRWKTTGEKHPQTFTCPWRQYTVEDVQVLTDAKVTINRRGNGYTVEAAVPLFETVFRQDRDWQTLLPRLAEEELVKVDAATLSRIMNVVPQEAMQ